MCDVRFVMLDAVMRRAAPGGWGIVRDTPVFPAGGVWQALGTRAGREAIGADAY
jgi:hypothetical protein